MESGTAGWSYKRIPALTFTLQIQMFMGSARWKSSLLLSPSVHLSPVGRGVHALPPPTETHLGPSLHLLLAPKRPVPGGVSHLQDIHWVTSPGLRSLS